MLPRAATAPRELSTVTMTSTAEGYMGVFDTDSRTVTIIWSAGDASGGALVYGVTAKQ